MEASTKHSLREMDACTKHSSVRFKQSAVTEFLTVEGVKADETWVHLYESETKRRPVKCSTSEK
jgi:hypothetical protein